MKYPLLRMEWWVRHAAFGNEVVPDVNWMLMMSSLSRGESGTMALPFCKVEWRRDSNGVVAEKVETSIRESELLTRKIFRNEGMLADSTFAASKSGTICFRRATFSLGFLNGKFVSVPIIKCAASRCESAAMTCGELKAGFRGTFLSVSSLLPFWYLDVALRTYKYSTKLEKGVRNNSKLPGVPQTNRNSLSLFNTLLSQPRRNNIAPLIQLPVTQSCLLAARDDCRSVAMRGDGFCEVLRDRMGEKRWLSETGTVSLIVCKAEDEGFDKERDEDVQNQDPCYNSPSTAPSFDPFPACVMLPQGSVPSSSSRLLRGLHLPAPQTSTVSH